MINLYLSSLFLLFLATFLFLPLLAFRGYKYLGVLLFFFALLLLTIFRPYQIGIDNSNFISVLINDKFLSSDLFTDDFFKYSPLYFLAYFIPGTWQKLFFLNTLFLVSLIYFQNRFIRRVSLLPTGFNGTFVFLLLSYDSLIIPPLVLVHFKQFIAFCLINCLCFRRINNEINLPDFSSVLLTLFIFLIHPAYIGFIVFFYSQSYLSTIITDLQSQ